MVYSTYWGIICYDEACQRELVDRMLQQTGEGDHEALEADKTQQKG